MSYVDETAIQWQPAVILAKARIQLYRLLYCMSLPWKSVIQGGTLLLDSSIRRRVDSRPCLRHAGAGPRGNDDAGLLDKSDKQEEAIPAQAGIHIRNDGSLNQQNNICVLLVLVWAFTFAPGLAAVSYTLESPGDSLIGAITTVHARYEDTLPDIARAKGLGHLEIKLANPGVDTWLPGEGEEIVLPTLFVLPDAPRNGIVLNIPEMRLYYFPPGQTTDETIEVITHPVGVGRQGWGTPYINTRIIQKKTRPSWYPPESIRKEHAEMGDPLPKRVPPGPNNPLGNYAMRLGLPEYIIHGTNKPFGIGMRVSHGCIRLYPEDIKSLYQQVKLKTPVNIVNQPYKVGIYNDRVYLEAHPYLVEDAGQFEGNLTSVVEMLINVTGDLAYEVDWDLAKSVIAESNGIPVEIGRINALEQPDKLTTAEIESSE